MFIAKTRKPNDILLICENFPLFIVLYEEFFYDLVKYSIVSLKRDSNFRNMDPDF